MIAELAHLISVLRGRIPHHLVCTLRGCERQTMSRAEWKVFYVHRHLLCPCGGTLVSVHPAVPAPRPTGAGR